MALNKWIFVAAAIMGLTVFVHVFAGGPEVYDPVRSADLAPELIAVLSVIWHGVTAILAIMSGALFWLSRHDNTALTVVLLATNSAFVALFLGYGMVDLGSLWPMPQWMIFSVVSLLILAGQGRRV